MHACQNRHAHANSVVKRKTSYAPFRARRFNLRTSAIASFCGRCDVAGFATPPIVTTDTGIAGQMHLTTVG